MSAEGKGAAGPPGVGGEEPAEAPPGPGRQVCASAAGVTALTDRTKRLRLRSGQEPAAPDGSLKHTDQCRGYSVYSNQNLGAYELLVPPDTLIISTRAVV
ncbi:UNVERIFIED_CONTAM: hypothetical protein K2H54_062590 [Gekko kuhli]